jgi:geranyl-CoA carboxylase beta subunit
MGGAQAGKVLRIVTEEKQLKMGMELDEKMLDQIEQMTAAKLEAGSTALFGTSRIWDDGLIDPRDTRKLMCMLLDMCDEAKHRSLQSNSFGVSRF